MNTISLKVELLNPTIEKKKMYEKMTEINTNFSNFLLNKKDLKGVNSPVFKEFSSEKFPSAIVNQTIREVKSKIKNQNAQVFKKFWCVINNQNSKIEYENSLYKVSFPTLEKKIGVPLLVKPFQKKWLDEILNGNAKQGAIELFKRKNKWFINIAISFENKPTVNSKIMGIDLGLKNLATCGIGTKSLFFKGNEVAYKRRKFSSRRKKLGKLKKLSVIKKSKGKESRWMKDQNHKISRQIINFAKTSGAGIIRMEDLTGIRMAKSKKEAGRNLNNWAFYQLQTFISYKANIEGIKVEFVDPKYTSQTCKCGHRDKKSRNSSYFRCTKCGHSAHADFNAAINISKAIAGISKKKKAI